MRPANLIFVFAKTCVFSAVLTGGAVAAAPSPMRGLPFLRSYAYEDIGDVPRGSRLGFDRFGRLAVIYDAVYAVLNDTAWLDLAEPERPGRILMSNVVPAPDGRSYYGGRGTWGYTETGPDGLIHPVSLAPAQPPEWIRAASFTELLATRDGVYFSSWNGLLFWSFRARTNTFFQIPRLACTFRVGDRVYVSAYDAPTRYVDPASGTLVVASHTDIERRVVIRSAPLDDARSLVAFDGGELEVFDRQHTSPWKLWPAAFPNGRISVMRALTDGRIAIAITGRGVLLCSREGEVELALTSSEFHSVNALANREPGVLWIATANSIEKVLYGSPISAFNRQLGVTVNWPNIATWAGHICIASDGTLFRSEPETPGEPVGFQPEPYQPPHGTWVMAAAAGQLIVGNGFELMALQPDETTRPLRTVPQLTHLVPAGANRVFAIGRKEIALFEYRDGSWIEPYPRIPGLPFPSIAHGVGGAAWIEMGGDGVARVWAAGGKLNVMVVSNASWTRGLWVNIGSVGEVAVLSSLHEEPRRYFDERSGTWSAQPKLEALLNRSPFWIARMAQDDRGVIWATHNEGLVRFTPKGDDYEMDADSFDLMNDRYPSVHILGGDDVWMSAERSLYHIDRTWIPTPRPSIRPIIVSVLDVPHHRELLTGGAGALHPLRLPYASNTLTFRFFSGSDVWRRAPRFEYRLSAAEPWTPVDGSVLGFRSLREGRYRLEVRMAAVRGRELSVTHFDFEITPPWTRSWPVYTALALAIVGVLVGSIGWSNHLARRRNRQLEHIVRERTRELADTIGKLKDETENAATLAERNRLANEIHDSVQQGLTGAILQLDTTMKLPIVADDLRSRLAVVRNMISYSRQEVQHAVWDMESPLLDGCNLGDALRNLTTFVESGDAEIDVSVEGEPVQLSREINHNLLRIAQEASTNAFRHAQAARISIRLEYRPQAVVLTVSDEGVGFAVDEVLQKNTRHLGLRGLRARAKRIGADLNIQSVHGCGTTIQTTLPLEGLRKEDADAISFRH